MNWLDVLLLLIVGLALLSGVRKGLAREGVGFAALIIGLIAGFYLYGTVGYYLIPYVSSRDIANLLGFLIVFFSILLLGGAVGALLAKLLKWVHLSWLDRLLGAGFGLVRGVLISAVLIIAMMAFAPKSPPTSVVESRVAPYVVEGARIIVSAAPYELKKGFERSYERAKEAWGRMVNRGVRRMPTDAF